MDTIKKMKKYFDETDANEPCTNCKKSKHPMMLKNGLCMDCRNDIWKKLTKARELGA